MSGTLSSADAAPAPEAQPPAPLPAAAAGPVRRVPSQALLAGAHELEIEHGTQVYRLRLTSLGKLILTK